MNQAPAASGTGWRPGPRWWLIASISFVGLVCACAPFALALAVAVMIGTMDTTGPTPVMILLVVGTGLGTPALGAVVVASVAEMLLRARGRPDRARASLKRVFLIVAIVLSPLVILPLWLTQYSRQSKRDMDATRRKTEAYNTRPIVASDTAGFCAPPVWEIRGGHARVQLAIRVKREGRYAVRIVGQDTAGNCYASDSTRSLGPGVTQVTALLMRSWGESPGDTVNWPLYITAIDVSPDTGGGTIRPEVDQRYGDSLYVLRP